MVIAAPEPNTLLVDYRVGSKDLFPALLKLGVRASLAKPPNELVYGDCCWLGNGPDGMVEVGVERKNVFDFVSSMRENRLSGHQVSGMCETYDVRYLLLEGEWAIKDGTVWAQNKWNVWKELKPGVSRPVSAGEMVGFISAIVNQAGFGLIRTCGADESAYWLRYYWGWWQKPWEEHEALGIGGVGGSLRGAKGEGKVKLVKPDLAWCMAAQLPGLGAKRSREISNGFGSAREFAGFMYVGEEGDWERLDGVGKVGAKKVVEALDRKRK